AWQARDTVIAVVGWQRALRLDPRADEPRERLARVSAPQHRVGTVWPLPPLPLGVLGLLLWMAGWGWSAALARAQRRSRWPLLVLLPGALCIIGAAYLDRTLAAADAVVIAERTPLRAL